MIIPIQAKYSSDMDNLTATYTIDDDVAVTAIYATDMETDAIYSTDGVDILCAYSTDDVDIVATYKVTYERSRSKKKLGDGYTGEIMANERLG